jgi:hypothetical protein
MNPMPEYQPIEPLEPMNNNPSGKSRMNWSNLRERLADNVGMAIPITKPPENGRQDARLCLNGKCVARESRH